MFNDIKNAFNRALKGAGVKKEAFFTAVLLLISAMIVLFCRAMGAYLGSWGVWSLTFFALFLVAIPLQATGVLLIRTYEKNRKNSSFSLKETLMESWDSMAESAFLAFPLLLGIIVMAMLVGIFLLLKEIPFLGTFLGVILSFGPYLLVAGSFVLLIAELALFFFIVPMIALEEKKSLRGLFSNAFSRISSDPFSHLLLLLIALLPAVVGGGILWKVFLLTQEMYAAGSNPVEGILQGFFLIIPAIILWTPFFVFFFNFAAEGYLFEKTRSPLGKVSDHS